LVSEAGAKVRDVLRDFLEPTGLPEVLGGLGASGPASGTARSTAGRGRVGSASPYGRGDRPARTCGVAVGAGLGGEIGADLQEVGLN